MWRRGREPNHDRIAVGQTEVVHRMAGAMARCAAVAGLVAGVLGILLAGLGAGVPGVLGAGLATVLGTATTLLTPLLMLLARRLEPAVVMLVSFAGFALKAVVVLAVLFTLGSAPALDRMSLAVTLLVVFVATTAAEAWAGNRVKVVLGAGPGTA